MPHRQHPPAIDACVRDALARYFADLGEHTPCDLHAKLIALVEKPLLEITLAQAGGKQALAAQWLGINRNTLRRKLLEHRLIEP